MSSSKWTPRFIFYILCNRMNQLILGHDCSKIVIFPPFLYDHQIRIQVQLLWMGQQCRKGLNSEQQQYLKWIRITGMLRKWKPGFWTEVVQLNSKIKQTSSGHVRSKFKTYTLLLITMKITLFTMKPCVLWSIPQNVFYEAQK